MKSASLASVLTIVLGITSAYAASPDKVNMDKAVHEGAPQTKNQTQAVTENYDNGKETKDSVQEKREAAREPKSELSKDIQEGLDDASASMRATADDIKAFFVEDDMKKSPEPVTIRKNDTAKALLGADVLDPNGKDIADLKDIIIDADGNAALVVVSDGGVLGIGNKLAAFDYKTVVSMTDKGDVRMALTQDMIDKAKDFSYDRDDMAKAKVIPAGSFSVDELLDGDLRDDQGEKVGSIDNLSIVGGKAERVIVKFHKKMSLAGDYAALDYGALKKTRNATGSVDLRMTPAQSSQFARFSKSSMK